MKTFLDLLLWFFIVILPMAHAFAGFPNGFVTQTNIFSGEVASNLTTGAPLVVSSSGKVTTGINCTELSFSSTLTTTSASDVVMSGMTTTPVAGTYQVIFSTWFTNSTGNKQATISVYVGGSQQAHTVRKTLPFSGSLGSVNDGEAISTNAILTVDGSQAIAIKWSTTGGTLSAANGTFDLCRFQ